MSDQDKTQTNQTQEGDDLVIDVHSKPQTQTDTAPDTGGTDPAWLPGRLDRAKATAVGDLLAALGVESVDALKSKLVTLNNIEKKNQTALETAQKDYDTEKQKREAAEQQLADTLKKQRQFLIHSAVTQAAQAARAKKPGDVLLWAQTDENMIELDSLLDDEGNLVEKQVKALVDAAKKARPDWFRGDGPGSPSNSDGTAPELDAKVRKEAQAEQQRRTRSAWH